MNGEDTHPVFMLETERLSLRRLNLEDAPFILELLNEAAFLRFIGGRGVRSLEDARAYLAKGPLSSYQRLGFGLWLVRSRANQEALGMCGLIKRDALQDVDLGYAFIERFWLQGYASEAAMAVKNYALGVLGLRRLVAITDQENTGSIRVLEKIGMRYERLVRLADEGEELKLFAVEG